MKLHSKIFSIFSLKTVAFLLFIFSISNAKLEYELICGEPGNNKIKLFFFADGYIESQKNYYNDKVQSLVDTLFTISPFKEYKNLFTAYRVWTPFRISCSHKRDRPNFFWGLLYPFEYARNFKKRTELFLKYH